MSDRASMAPTLGELDRETVKDGVYRLLAVTAPAVRNHGRSGAVVVYFLALALLVFYPLFGRGYVLSLDMVFAPGTDYAEFLLRTKGPLYYGRLPIAVVLDALGLVVADWVLQKVVLVTVVAGSGLATYRALHDRTTTGRIFAGTVYAFNPFVYVRLLAGHWYLLLGYAVLPLAVVAFARYLSGEGTLRRAVLWTTVVSAFDPHAAVLLALAGGCVGAATLARSSGNRRRVRARRLVGFVAAALAVNAYWILPGLAGLLGGGTQLATASAHDVAAFSARGTVDGNVPLSVAMLYGFWRGGAVLPVEVLPQWVALGLFVGILFFATYGWFAERDALSDGLVLATVCGFLLALGVSYPVTTPAFRWLYEQVPLMTGMRDTQKFVALLVLGYTILGARGVDHLLSRAGLADGLSVRTDPRAWGDRSVDRRVVLAMLLAVVLVATPLGYTVTMFGGFAGQLHTTEYPDGWYATEERFEADEDRYRVLFLPWHQYMRFSWTERTVANPADLFFGPPVVHGRNLEVGGIESQATDPTHARITTLLQSTDHGAFGHALAPLGVKYVLLSKDADYRRYGFLDQQDDLEVVLDTETVVLYENVAFDRAPPPSNWPAAWTATPWWMLGVGSLISTVAVLALLAPRRNRPLGR